MRFLLRLAAGCLCVFAWITTYGAPPSKSSFSLVSSSFQSNSTLPVTYTCDGKNISPPLAWKNPPTNTASFALIMSDPDAPSGTFYHWVLFNIPHDVSELPENMQTPPVGTIVGMNNWQKPQYNGPCPPSGAAHRYFFTLYALDSSLQLTENADAQAVIAAMQNHLLGKAELVGKYKRGQVLSLRTKNKLKT